MALKKFVDISKQLILSKISVPLKVTICHHGMLGESLNHIIDKVLFNKYDRLPCPMNKILATYCWIDGSMLNMRSKDRILPCAPCDVSQLPGWSFDGSSTGQATTGSSDTSLKPISAYIDPFRRAPHILVLCETYGGDGKALPSNNRKFCNEMCEKIKSEEPWFGLEQEYMMLDVDGWGLGWPKGGGFPAKNYQFSYCGVGAKYQAGRDVCEAHARACLYANMAFEGTNAEVMFATWEYQIGSAPGIDAPDDLWMSRYILYRVAEDYGVCISLHPKPMGPDHPGSGMHHNFSTKTMRADGGIKLIEECLKKLEANHQKHMKYYSMSEHGNRMRLTGKFETPHYDKFSSGVADRGVAVRLQRSVKDKGKGFFEDRRPAADCDPYKVCGMIIDTCLVSGKQSDCGKSHDSKKDKKK